MINRWFPLGVAAGAAIEFAVTDPSAPPHLRAVIAGLLCGLGVLVYILRSEMDK